MGLKGFKEVGFRLINHPAYSSDSVLSDFWLFEIDIESKKRQIAEML